MRYSWRTSAIDRSSIAAASDANLRPNNCAEVLQTLRSSARKEITTEHDILT